MRKLLLDSLISQPLTEDPPAPDAAALIELSAKVRDQAYKSLGRSLAIRQVDAGSCNGCELENHALSNPYYDLERYGFHFVASPRHADVLLVTGPVTANMRTALLRTYAAMATPKWVVAAGDCARCMGPFAANPALAGTVDDILPVDIHIPGCPPTPRALLSGLLAVMEYQACTLTESIRP